jgi:Fic family protein
MKLMDEFIVFCNADQKNILQKISNIHFEFVKIHPFVDGN